MEENKINELLFGLKGGSLSVMCKMNALVSDEDVKALEAYLCLKRRPDTYEWQRDLYDLMHWLDITSDGFAIRLKEAYPQLTMQELNFCCLQRMGYSWEEIGGIMKVKGETVRRYVYRVCARLQIQGNKKDYEHFISSF